MLHVFPIYVVLSVPSSPLLLSEKNKGTSYLEISWTKPIGNVDSYKLRYKQSENSYGPDVDVRKDATSYQINDLSPGNPYTISLRSKAGSELSTEETITLTTGNDK